MELRDYQQRAIDTLYQRLQSGDRRLVMQAPTGAGKTRIAAELAVHCLENRQRMIFCVPALSLIDQTVDMFADMGICRGEIGVIQGQHEQTDRKRPLQIASAQTLARRTILPDHCQFWIIDECHRWYKCYGKLMKDEAWQSAPWIGLSATPWTKGLGKHFSDGLIRVTTLRELIDGGTLSDYRVFAPGERADLSGVRTVAGDYHEGQLADAMNRQHLVADVVQTWTERAVSSDGTHRPTILFAVDRAHAKTLRERFEAADIPTAYIDAFTDRDDREAVRRNMEAGDVHIVCNVGCLTTGIDWPWISCLQLVRPTKSKMLFVQMLGRGMRKCGGKDDCLILDHSTSTERLGFPCQITGGLNNGKEAKAGESPPIEYLPRPCPKCSFMKPAKHSGPCPQCGFQPKQVSKIENISGELREIKRPNGTGKHASAREKAMKDPARVFGMLRYIGHTRGYKSGWAAYKYKELYKDWPPRGEAPFAPPDPWLISWERSQRIKWAKSRSRF